MNDKFGLLVKTFKPFEQLAPDHPSSQLQTPGAMQSPLTQDEHTAAHLSIQVGDQQFTHECRKTPLSSLCCRCRFQAPSMFRGDILCCKSLQENECAIVQSREKKPFEQSVPVQPSLHVSQNSPVKWASQMHSPGSEQCPLAQPALQIANRDKKKG
jgi:hypothetical protein